MLKIGDNFDYQGKLPNFKRDSFDTLSLMKSFPETSINEGHISYCKENNKTYQYNSINDPNVNTGKWKEINFVPEGGLVNEVLTKTSSTTMDWMPIPNKLYLYSGNTDITDNSNDIGYQDEVSLGIGSNKVKIIGEAPIKIYAMSSSVRKGYITINMQEATSEQDGYMSKEDKIKLDGLTGAYVSIVTQAEYDSINPKEENRIYYIKD